MRETCQYNSQGAWKAESIEVGAGFLKNLLHKDD